MRDATLTDAERAKVYDPTVPTEERLALALRWLAQLREAEATARILDEDRRAR